MSVGRQLPKEIQAIFDDPEYGAGIGRKLKRENAIKMFVERFGMTEAQADAIFETFDADKNGVMTLREFRQFYATIGNRGQEIMDMFESMDKDKNGKLDAEEATAGLKALKTQDGKEITDEEVKFCINTNKGADGVIDVGELARMLIKLKIIMVNRK
ncbi:calcium-binding protein 1-like [Lineus longissimus]|uniref:calcium-binding protein 1-like n=1 Tax=Lineus longissimus TaxID=88925 RepID=UPI002B4C8E8B